MDKYEEIRIDEEVPDNGGTPVQTLPEFVGGCLPPPVTASVCYMVR
ncbi:hypothetical protein JXL83_05885 [candidate division WOR-3 bacterium]|nr:hypothetical protein [candidate division WOR-3 bacterium]